MILERRGGRRRMGGRVERVSRRGDEPGQAARPDRTHRHRTRRPPRRDVPSRMVGHLRRPAPHRDPHTVAWRPSHPVDPTGPPRPRLQNPPSRPVNRFNWPRLVGGASPPASVLLRVGGASRPACVLLRVGGASRPASSASHHRDTEDTERARRVINRRDGENAEGRIAQSAEGGGGLVIAGRLAWVWFIRVYRCPSVAIPGRAREALRSSAFIRVHLRFQKTQAGKPVPPTCTVVGAASRPAIKAIKRESRLLSGTSAWAGVPT